MDDLQTRTIRVMGDPIVRYTEDPVRMLRAIRLAAKLNFTIEKNTAAAIKELNYLIENVSSARLFDEIIKMSLCGYVTRVYELLQDYHIVEKLFPAPFASIKQDSSGSALTLLTTALQETDQRIASGKTINPAFLMAVFFWIPLQERVQQYVAEGVKLYPAVAKAEAEVLKLFGPLSIPRRLVAIIRDIWRLQYSLIQTRRNRVYRSFYHPRFRAAYDFMLIRNKAGEPLDELCSFWTEFQEVNHDDQERMIAHHQKDKKQVGRKNHYRKRPKKGNPNA